MLVHDFVGHPLEAQLSRELARRGHEVVHAYSPEFPGAQGKVEREVWDPPSLRFEGLRIGREFERYSLLTRSAHELLYGRRAVGLVRSFRPDVVLSSNTPLLVQGTLAFATRRVGGAFVFWLQDLLAVGASGELEKRMGRLGQGLSLGLRRFERRLLDRSDAVVPITSDFADLLASMNIARGRTFVVENWAPLEEYPARPRHNDWAEEHGLDRPFVFLYCGTLGLKHDPSLLLRLAEHYRAEPGVRVVVVSDGLGAEWLKREAAAKGLENLSVLGYQPYDALPNVLASADVLVVVLERDAGIFSVPSKVLGYLCAGRPVLGAVPADNLAARIINTAGAGRVTPPDNADALLAAADELRLDTDLRESMGLGARAYAEREFDIEAIASRFERVMDAAVRGN